MNKNRPAFTLMELIISITLISVIMIYLYQATDTMRTSNAFYENKSLEEQKKEQLFIALFTDIMNADLEKASIVEQEKKLDTLFFQSSNSHYGIINPFIGYRVSKNGTLYRMESHVPIRVPARLEDLPRIQMEIIDSNVEFFKIHKHGKSNALLFYYKQTGKPSVSFQLGV